MTLITDLTAGSSAWAGQGFLATKLDATTAVGAVNDDPMAGKTEAGEVSTNMTIASTIAAVAKCP